MYFHVLLLNPKYMYIYTALVSGPTYGDQLWLRLYMYMCDIQMHIYLLCLSCMHVFCSLIRDSAPVINTIIIGGCVLLLVTCYLLGVDTNTPQLDGDQPNISDAHLLEDSDKEGIPDRRNKRYAIICNVSTHVQNVYMCSCTCICWLLLSNRHVWGV